MDPIGTGFNSLIGTRQSTANPGTAEYYNTQTNQGFSDPTALSSFVNQNFTGVNTNPTNVFSTLSSGYQAPKAISADILNQPVTPTPFAQPNPTATPNIDSLFTTPEIQATAQDQQLQAIFDQRQALNNQLVGESSFTNQANEQYGVNQASKTINDLNSQLIQVKNDQAAIPTLLQQNNSSKGIAQPLIDRQQNYLLQQNAIKALSLSSLMAAAQGQLANAQGLADRAIAAKFDPIKEQLTALSNNADLIQNSPNYTIAQKNQAQKVQDTVNKQNYQLEQAKQDYADIHKIAIDAAQNGADAQTLQKISAATSPVEAARLAQVVTKQQNNQKMVQQLGIVTPYANRAGEIFNTKTGKPFATAQEFFKDSGVTSFSQAYAQGLIKDITSQMLNPQKLTEVSPGATLYDPSTGKAVFTAPQRASSSGSSSATATTPIANAVDQQVKDIIMSNPGEYGHAADQIQSLLGSKIATGSKYDQWLRDVYINKKDPNSLKVSTQNLTDPEIIAQAIMNGDQPPVLTGLYGKSAAVKATLEKKGFNLSKATQDWTATQKLLTTLNGAQQVRLKQAVSFASDSLSVIEDLNNQWKGGKFPAINKANLAAAKNGLYGSQAQQIATKLDAQISDLVSELGTVYKGGNSSTDESLKLAGQQLQSNWSQSQLQSAIDLARTNLQIRKNSILNTQVSGVSNNPYSTTNSNGTSGQTSGGNSYTITP